MNDRLNGCQLPQDAVVLSINSFGDRNNPIVFAAAQSINFKQLKVIVASRGDYSEVVMDGHFPVIVSPDPSFWIGKGGKIPKALPASLDIRFLKIVEKKS